MSVIGDLELVITTSSSGFTSGLRAAESQLSKFTQAIDSNSSKLQTISLATTAAGAGFLALAGIIATSSIKAASSFDALMAKNAVLTNMTQSQVQAMSDSILQMTRTIPQSADQLASGLYYVESAGFHGADALKILKDAAEAAAIGMTDTKTVADALTSILNAYHLSASNADNITNQMTQTVVQGKMEYGDLASSIGQVAPYAAKLGISYAQVGAALATMTRQGENASRGAESLRMMFESIINPTTQAQKEMAKIGLTADDLRKMVKDKGLPETLQELQDKFGGTAAVMQQTINVQELSKKQIESQTKALSDQKKAQAAELEQEKLNLEMKIQSLNVSQQMTEQVAHHHMVGRGAARHEETYYTTKTVTAHPNTSAIKGYRDQVNQLNDQLKQLGINTTKSDLALQKQGVAAVAAGSGAINADQGMAKLFGGIRGGTAAVLLSGQNLDTVKQILQSMNVPLDYTDKKFQEFAKKNPQVAFALLQNSINEANIRLGNALLPTVLKFVNAITPLVQKLADWINHHQKLSATIVIAIGILGGLLIIIGAVTAAVALISAPILAASAVIAAFAALAITNFGLFKQVLVASGIGAIADFTIQFIANLLKGENAFVAFKNAIAGVVSDIQKLFSNLGKVASDVLSHLDPFAKHSPSLVDQVTSGVAVIKAQYGSLANIQLPNLAAAQGNMNAGMNFNSVTNNSPVTMNNSFNVQGQASASNVAKYMAFQLEHKGLV